MLGVNTFEDRVLARLLDFFDWKSSWHRRLWGSGAVLTLKEVLEASEAVQAGVLSESALHDLSKTAIKLAGADPGAGAPPQRRLLQQSLEAGPRFLGAHYWTLRQITKDVEENYLDRWMIALSAPSDYPSPERTARSIASHLLDLGLSSDFLHRWWAYKIRKKGTHSLAKLLAAAHGLARQPPRDYRVLVAFEIIPESQYGLPPHWLDGPAVSKWLRSNGFEVSGLKQNGGAWLTVQARDPGSAVEASVETIDRIAVRVAVGTTSQLTPVPWAWVAGHKRPFPLRRRFRGVEVHALHREKQLYSEGITSILDAAIELLAPLASSSPSTAVAGGWAAIEALLCGPGDGERVVAGDRMASLVACSFPRAELTTLSYRIEEMGGEIASRLRLCRGNRDRADLIARAIQNGENLTVRDSTDAMALARIRDLLGAPSRTLRSIEGWVAAAFRRLYRQRNLVLHWGKTDAVALRASLKTVAPLVGAGMDRIAHALFIDKIGPLELAARARIRLKALDSYAGAGIVDLLG